jgi:hypothetical protein
MAKLNQSQRDYFRSRVTVIQQAKKNLFIIDLKASLPDYDPTYIQITRENIASGVYRLKTLDEIMENFQYNHAQGGYVSAMFVRTVSDVQSTAKATYDRKLAEFTKIQTDQAQKFNDQIMLGGDDAALAALATLETEDIVLPD